MAENPKWRPKSAIFMRKIRLTAI